MRSGPLFPPVIPIPVAPSAEVIAALGVDLLALKTSLAESGKINLMRIEDVARYEAERIDYRVYDQWLIFWPVDASGMLGAVPGVPYRGPKWVLDAKDLAEFEVKLIETLADAEKLHGRLIQLDAYLARYKNEKQFQADVKEKKTYPCTNFNDSEVRTAMNQYSSKCKQLEATKVLLADYFTKLLQATNNAMPENGITYLDFNSKWNAKDKLRSASLSAAHKLVAESLGIKPDVVASSAPSTLRPA